MSLLMSQTFTCDFPHSLCEIMNWHHSNCYLLLYCAFFMKPFYLKEGTAWLRDDVGAGGVGGGVPHDQEF